MTCIVGLIDGKNVLVGGDSAGVNTGNLALRLCANEKVFARIDESGVTWVFGFTTSFRMGQLVQYDLKLPKITQDDRNNLHQFMVKKFIPSLRKCLEAGGWMGKKEDREWGGQFIVGLLGELFVIIDDFQVHKPLLPYTAVGSGADVAHGSIHTSKNHTPEERIILALEAAETFNVGVRRPFKVVQTNKTP